ncbi:MAG: hypothetical protein MUF61_03545, partial [archaeon]|nr:hypothetical protein [archaeon]
STLWSCKDCCGKGRLADSSECIAQIFTSDELERYGRTKRELECLENIIKREPSILKDISGAFENNADWILLAGGLTAMGLLLYWCLK